MNAFVDDFAGDASTTGQVRVGAPVVGRIQSGYDEDWFAADLNVDEIYQASLTSAVLSEFYLDIFDPEGWLIYGASTYDGSGATVVFSPNDPGVHHLAASSSQTGRYTVSISSLGFDDFRADTTTAGTLVLGGSVNGNIQYGGDEDWFQVSLTKDTTYRLTYTSPEFSTAHLNFYDSSGTHVAASRMVSGSAELAINPMETGTYFVGARSNTNGAYQISMSVGEADDHADDATTSSVLAEDASVSAGFQFNGDQDWFQIFLNAGEIYEVELQGSDLGFVRLRVLDEDGSYIGGGSGLGNTVSGAFLASETTSAFLAASSDNLGAYQLTYRSIGTDDFAADASTTGVLSTSEVAQGKIQFWKDTDWFLFSAVAGEIYAVEASSDDGISVSTRVGGLPGGSGSVQYGTNATNADLFMVRESGEYYVSASSSDIGTYQLALSLVGQDDFGNDKATSGTMSVGSSIPGRVQFQDDEDWIRIDLDSLTYYAFELQSDWKNFRDFSLIDENGTVIATDDSGYDGYGFNVLTEAAGTYYLSVSSWTVADYQISASFISTDDFLSNSSTTGVLELGKPSSGSIDYDRDADWFQFSAEAGGIFKVTLSAEEGAPIGLNMAGPNENFFGEVVVENGAQSITFGAPETASYYATVGAPGPVDYEISVSLVGTDDYAGNTSTHGVIATDAPVVGAIQFDGDTDWFRFDVTAGTLYTLHYASSGLGFTDVWVRDGSGSVLSYLPYFAPTRAFSFQAEETASYFLSFSASGLGEYSISLTSIQTDITGTRGADSLVGSPGDDQITALRGKDIVLGGDGNDEIFGGDGADTLNGERGDDTLDGGRGQDTMTGGDGNDFVDGDISSDDVRGGPGHDQLLGGQGSDTLFGDEGDDSLFGESGSDTLYGGWGEDTLHGDGGRDFADGGRDDDVLYGGGGHDTLVGERGRDTLNGGFGWDELSGGAGMDVLYGDRGSDTLLGDDGGDLLFGGRGHDDINGGAGNDTIDAGAGNDLIRGVAGSGSDTITTGTGWDTIALETAFGFVEVTDFQVRTDRIDLSNTTAASHNDLVFTDNAVDTIIDLDGGDRIVLLDTLIQVPQDLTLLF